MSPKCVHQISWFYKFIHIPILLSFWCKFCNISFTKMSKVLYFHPCESTLLSKRTSSKMSDMCRKNEYFGWSAWEVFKFSWKLIFFLNRHKLWNSSDVIAVLHIMTNKLTLPKIRYTVCQLSGVPARFQVYSACLHVAHQNTSVNGANFIVNCHKTPVITLKSYYSIQMCIHSLIFGRVYWQKKRILSNVQLGKLF